MVARYVPHDYIRSSLQEGAVPAWMQDGIRRHIKDDSLQGRELLEAFADSASTEWLGRAGEQNIDGRQCLVSEVEALGSDAAQSLATFCERLGVGFTIHASAVQGGVLRVVIWPVDDDYWGSCPRCGKCDGYLNVERCHWNVCDTCGVAWSFGANLMSDWKYETKEEWERNAEKICSYEHVEPLYRGR